MELVGDDGDDDIGDGRCGDNDNVDDKEDVDYDNDASYIGARDSRGKRWKQDGVWIQEGEKREVGCLRWFHDFDED